jgi:hypothetical protein
MTPSNIQQRIINRLIEAFITGNECRVQDGDHRLPAISLSGFVLIAQHELWHQAAEQILRLDAIHRDAQQRFLRLWTRVPFRNYISDDDLCFAFLRKVLPSPPPYDQDQLLYRGQLKDEPVQPSWARQPHIALKFAWHGLSNVDPIQVAILGPSKNPRDNAVVLKATVPASSIIYATPHFDEGREGEFIIDPRGIAVTAEQAEHAAVWIKAETAMLLEIADAMDRLPAKYQRLLRLHRRVNAHP